MLLLDPPQDSTVKHDGKKVVVFTKQEYRQLDGPITSTGKALAAAGGGGMMVDEGEEADDMDFKQQKLSSSAKRRQKQQGVWTTSSSSYKPGGRKGGQKKGGRATFKDLQQRMMEEYMVKSGSALL